MNRPIKTFSDGSRLEFGPGRIDDWCVYFTEGGRRRVPRDEEYFTQLKHLAQKHTGERIYADFVRIYERTTAWMDEAVLAGISNLAAGYDTHAPVMEKLLTLLYAAMIAEENKTGAVLKKRVKRLGLHQVLLEKLPPKEAAEFSRGKPWREIAAECERRGF